MELIAFKVLAHLNAIGLKILNFFIKKVFEVLINAFHKGTSNKLSKLFFA